MNLREINSSNKPKHQRHLQGYQPSNGPQESSHVNFEIGDQYMEYGDEYDLEAEGE